MQNAPPPRPLPSQLTLSPHPYFHKGVIFWWIPVLSGASDRAGVAKQSSLKPLCMALPARFRSVWQFVCFTVETG